MASKPKKESEVEESIAWNKELSKRRNDKRKARENVTATTSRTKKGSGDS
jgi:hypothetical protein